MSLSLKLAGFKAGNCFESKCTRRQIIHAFSRTGLKFLNHCLANFKSFFLDQSN